MQILIAAVLGFILGVSYMWSFGRTRRWWDAMRDWAYNGGYPETMRRDVLSAMRKIEDGEQL